MISVIIPVKGEAPPAGELFDRLHGGVETIVAADGTTPEETLHAYRSAGLQVLALPFPRGRRLAEAARSARGEVLLFLHADTALPEGWAPAVERAMAEGAVGGAFRLGFSEGGTKLAWVAFWANLRTRLTRVPYGDQAPFVRRDVYEKIGGHRPWPLLEDVDLARRLKKEGRIVILPLRVRTSSRRYLERGVARTVLLNWKTLIRFRAGGDPEKLAEEYRR